MRHQKNKSKIMKKLYKTKLDTNSVSTLKDSKVKSSLKDKLTTLALVISLIATTLALVGYGVAVGANIEFDIPHEMLFQSPFELLELSVWAISRLVALTAVFSPAALYIQSFPRAVAVGAIVFFTVLIAYAAIKLPDPAKRYQSKIKRWREKILALPHKNTPLAVVLLQATIGGILAIFIAPIAVVLLALAVVSLAIFMPAIAFIGVQAFQTHLEDNVIKPDSCQPILNRTYRMKREARSLIDKATCLSITVGNHSPIVGREILSTSSATLLFDPASGQVWRLPLRNALVKTIDTLTENS